MHASSVTVPTSTGACLTRSRVSIADTITRHEHSQRNLYPSSLGSQSAREFDAERILSTRRLLPDIRLPNLHRIKGGLDPSSA